MIREKSEEAPANWQGHGPLTQLQESIEGKEMDRAGDKNYGNSTDSKKCQLANTFTTQIGGEERQQRTVQKYTLHMPF